MAPAVAGAEPTCRAAYERGRDHGAGEIACGPGGARGRPAVRRPAPLLWRCWRGPSAPRPRTRSARCSTWIPGGACRARGAARRGPAAGDQARGAAGCRRCGGPARRGARRVRRPARPSPGRRRPGRPSGIARAPRARSRPPRPMRRAPRRARPGAAVPPGAPRGPVPATLDAAARRAMLAAARDRLRRAGGASSRPRQRTRAAPAAGERPPRRYAPCVRGIGRRALLRSPRSRRCRLAAVRRKRGGPAPPSTAAWRSTPSRRFPAPHDAAEQPRVGTALRGRAGPALPAATLAAGTGGGPRPGAPWPGAARGAGRPARGAGARLTMRRRSPRTPIAMGWT